METDKVATIGIRIQKGVLSDRYEDYLKALLSDKRNNVVRMLFTLGDHLAKYSKKFDRIRYVVTDEKIARLPNGRITGILQMVNKSEIDIGVEPIVMYERNTDFVDFAYPYELNRCTFVTQKAEYKPQIFGILQTFSLPLWIAIISTFIAMSLVYYITFKRRYSFDKILLDVSAVLLRQSSVLKPSSMIKHLLVFSWILGAMFLCLAYDSVILSFLSFPPIIQVKDVPQLAKAIKEGRYHCVANPVTAIPKMLLESKDENLKIIGRDIVTNNLNFKNIRNDFYYNKGKPNVALIRTNFDLESLTIEQKFVSQDRFIEAMISWPIRKDFCCKKLVDNFVHQMMASGLYFKFKDDKAFLLRLPTLMKQEKKDTSKRVLTLIDVAPAFIFLIFGHIISFLVLIVEIWTNRMKKKYKKSNHMQRRF